MSYIVLFLRLFCIGYRCAYISQEGFISGDQGLVAKWLLVVTGHQGESIIGLCLLSDEFVSIRLELRENVIAILLGR